MLIIFLKCTITTNMSPIYLFICLFVFYVSLGISTFHCLLTSTVSERKKERKKKGRKGPRGVMVKALGCEIIVSEFELQSRYYIHFRANTLGNGTNPPILPAMG